MCYVRVSSAFWWLFFLSFFFLGGWLLKKEERWMDGWMVWLLFSFRLIPTAYTGYIHTQRGGIREVEGNRKDMSSWVNKVSHYLPSPLHVCEVIQHQRLSAIVSVCSRLCLYTARGGGDGGAVFLYLFISIFPHYMEQLGCKHYGWKAVIRRALWTCKAHGSSPPWCIVTKCDKKAAVEESILIWIEHHISRKSTAIPFLSP